MGKASGRLTEMEMEHGGVVAQRFLYAPFRLTADSYLMYTLLFKTSSEKR